MTRARNLLRRVWPPARTLQARELGLIALREWDRMLIGLAFLSFAAWDLAKPDENPLAAMIEAFRIAQFGLAGLAYIAGVLLKSYVLRGLGTVLYSTGLATIAVIVIFGSGSPTLVLIGAFALQGFADLRRLGPKNLREAVLDEVALARRTREGGR